MTTPRYSWISALLLGLVVLCEAAVWQNNFLIFGRVSLPDGRPARRVKVFLEVSSGMRRDLLSDDDGRYEFRGVGRGKYQVSAINPEAPEQYSDPAEGESSRASANRLQINVYLRLPATRTKGSKPGVVSATEASQVVPKSARKAYEEGLKLQKQNQLDQALAQFSKAIQLYPEYFQALTDRGNLLMQQNKLNEAEADFERSLQINAKYPPTLRGLGYCQIQHNKFADALGNLEKSYSLEPNVPMTLLLLGYANLSLNRYEEARQSLQEALKLGPESAARAHVYLAQVYAHEQKFNEAAEEIRAYLKLKPDAADAGQLKTMEADWRARGKVR
jgi:tetratricopeptide (TPR) repeat protein